LIKCDGFQSPNYTQIPNDLFDLIHDMTEAELKCVLAICRITYGYQRGKARASYTTLQKDTGLSRQAVFNGMSRAVERGIVGKTTGKGVTIWDVNEIDQSATVVNEIERSSIPNRTPSIKEKKKKKESNPFLKHPAIKAYRNGAHLQIAAQWRKEVAGIVGEDSKDVDTWGELVHNWVGSGWNPKNVKGMLDKYKKEKGGTHRGYTPS